MATKNQLKKIERLSDEIYSLWLEINENNEVYKNKEIEKMQTSLDNKDEELNRYCIKINISEEELFSIDSICNHLDGVNYNEYMTNYENI